jgi:hypothetical protein
MAREKEGLGKGKKKSKKMIVIALIFIVGLIVGIYLGMEVVPQLLNASQQSELQDCSTAKDLLSQEVDCFLDNCASETVQFCGAQ